MKYPASYYRQYRRDRKRGILRRVVKARTAGDVSNVPYGVPEEFKRFAQARVYG